MSVLALDLGTVTGWALSADGELLSGVWRLSGRGLPYNARGLNLWWYLSHMHEVHGLTRVAQEAPIVFPGRPSGAAVAFGLTHACEMWCEHKGIAWTVLRPATIKKHATGRGNADKLAMVDAAAKRWPSQKIQTHDQADALWLLDYELRA